MTEELQEQQEPQKQKMTAIEAVAEMGKVSRFLKAFERMSEVAESCVGFERERAELEKATESARENLTAVVKDVESAKNDLLTTRQNIENEKVAAADAAEKALAAAKAEVEKLREEAAILQEDIKGLELTKEQVTNDVVAVKAELADVHDQIAKAKEDFAARATSI